MGIGNIFPYNSFSPSGGIYTSAIENKFLQEGVIFGISKRLTLLGGTPTYMVFDPTAFTGNVILQLPMLVKAFGAGPIFIDLYTNPTYTGGTIVNSINFNFNSSKVSNFIVKLNPTVTDLGTKMANEYAVFSDGVSANSKLGGEASTGNLLFDLKLSNKYLIVFNNQDTTSAYATVATDWVEISY
jgi:hypothetical protein